KLLFVPISTNIGVLDEKVTRICGRARWNLYIVYRSIVRTSGVAAEALNDFIANNPTIPITHPAELTLSKQILKLADCILQVLDSLMLHQLCDYLYQLATIFHDFYSACYVIEKKSGKFQFYCCHLFDRVYRALPSMESFT
ncbi:DALR anticodon binding domain protein, partial [Trichostrongylus colubriformis]